MHLEVIQSFTFLTLLEEKQYFLPPIAYKQFVNACKNLQVNITGPGGGTFHIMFNS